jgi:gag-polypeptide of LTR copia-type
MSCPPSPFSHHGQRVDQPMANWIAEVHGIAFQLGEISITVDNEDLILILTTMGLPKSYDTFVISLDTINTTTLTLNFIITCLLNKQSQQSGSNPSHHPLIQDLQLQL